MRRPNSHATAKKSNAQLKREINEALARKPGSAPQPRSRVAASKDSEQGRSHDALAAELIALGDLDGWKFSYEYPGLFLYSRSDSPFLIYFTPDWDHFGTLPIQVQDADGNYYNEHSSEIALPPAWRSGKRLQSLVRPTLNVLAPREKSKMRSRAATSKRSVRDELLVVRDSEDLGMSRGTRMRVVWSDGSRMDVDVPSLDMRYSGLSVDHPDIDKVPRGSPASKNIGKISRWKTARTSKKWSPGGSS